VRQTTIVLLLILAAAMFALWFLNTHEKVSRDIYVGYHGEARVNDHLAAEMLLQELGVAADSKSTLTPTEWLPDTVDSIIVRLSPSIAIGAERAALLSWVSAGGSLILLPPYQEVADTSEFLASLGFMLAKIDYDDSEDGDETKNTDDDTHADESSAPRDEYRILKYSQRNRISTTEEAVGVQVIAAADSVIVARSEWGEGLITLFSSDSYFSNGSLNYADHARLLADVVAGEYVPGKVWFIYETTFSSLWELTWRAAPYFILGVAMSFGLWLWAVMPAFGPRVNLIEVPRRSIIEHVQAAGIFLWRHDGSNELAQSAAQLLLHDAETRHPGLGRLSMQQQAEAIARMTGMSPQAVLDVLNGSPGKRQREFVDDMKSVQTIRKEL